MARYGAVARAGLLKSGGGGDKRHFTNQKGSSDRYTHTGRSFGIPGQQAAQIDHAALARGADR